MKRLSYISTTFDTMPKWFAYIGCILLIFGSKAQVLEPLGTGLPGRVVASYATDDFYFALYDNTETIQANDYALAKWDGVAWTTYPGLYTPAPIVPTEGEYNFHSIAYYKGEIYVGAYIANAKKDAEIPVTHLYRWSEQFNQWMPETGVVDTRNNGIVTMAVFDGKLIVAGKFQSVVNGQSVQNIAAFDGNEWSYLGTNDLDQGANGIIRSLMVVGDRLYMAGDFDRFAGDLTGNIAYYTASNGGWGGLGSPFNGEVLELASYGSQLAALGKDVNGGNEVRTFDVNWSNPLDFANFSVAKPNTIAGLSDYLLIGGDFVKDASGTSLIRYENKELLFTGNKLSGSFKLGQRGEGAFVWGDFAELNTDISYFSGLKYASGCLNGDLFMDVNNNCIKDDGEIGIPESIVRITNKQNGESHFAVTDANGHFTIGLSEGDYAIEFISKRHMTNMCQSNYATQIRNGRYSYVSLGQYMEEDLQDLEVTVLPIYPNELKPGDTIQGIVKIQNNGSQTLDKGTIHVNHDLPLANFYSVPSADDYNGIQAVYTLNDLKPFEQRYIKIQFLMPFQATEKDEYLVTAKTGSLLFESDKITSDNTSNMKLSIGKRGNSEKSVEKSSDLGIEIPQDKKTWTYTVNFKNMGGSTVNKAVVIDTLSDKLPLRRVVLESFYPTNAKYSIQQGRILVVTFDPANLKSTEASPTKSRGWVQYSLDLYDQLNVNTTVDNIAYVDFDSRWKENSENCKVAVVQSSTNISGLKLPSLKVYPNPANNSIHVEWLKEEIGGKYQLINMSGQLVFEAEVNAQTTTMDVSNLPSGVYSLKTHYSITKVIISPNN